MGDPKIKAGHAGNFFEPVRDWDVLASQLGYFIFLFLSGGP